jgi:hypothetical protein
LLPRRRKIQRRLGTRFARVASAWTRIGEHTWSRGQPHLERHVVVQVLNEVQHAVPQRQRRPKRRVQLEVLGSLHIHHRQQPRSNNRQTMLLTLSPPLSPSLFLSFSLPLSHTPSANRHVNTHTHTWWAMKAPQSCRSTCLQKNRCRNSSWYFVSERFDSTMDSGHFTA